MGEVRVPKRIAAVIINSLKGGVVPRIGLPYVTATHDRENLRSGAVMRRLGMTYRYSYEERWQPKDLLVTFRMYQIDLVDPVPPTWNGYWNASEAHFVEPGL